MNASHFNLAMLVGWLLVLVGGMWIHPAAGLAAGGLLLIVLTLVAVRLGGGLFSANPEPRRQADRADEVTG